MQEHARRHRKRPRRDDHSVALDVQRFLEMIVRGISAVPGSVSVHMAEGKGTAHYEIRGPRNAIRHIEKLEDGIFTLSKVVARARGRVRVSLHLYMTKIQEVAQVPHQDLDEFVLELARTMVDSPEEVILLPARGDGFVHFEIQCERGDVGTLLGQRASHVTAIRSIVDAAGSARGVRTTLQVLQRDGD